MMTEEERKSVAVTWVLCAKFYDKNLDKDLVELMIGDVARFNYEDVMNAFTQFRMDTRNKNWPRSSDIVQIINPKDDPNSLAIEASARCLEAVRKYGWTNESEAKRHIGDLGWYGVTRYGGWKFICENLGSHIEPSTFIAQMREIIRSRANSSNQGFNETPYELGDSKIKNLIGITAKSLELK